MKTMRLHLKRVLLSLCVLSVFSFILLQLFAGNSVQNAWNVVVPSMRFFRYGSALEAGSGRGKSEAIPKINVWEPSDKTDRILEQMSHIPDGYKKAMEANVTMKPKVIYVQGGMGDFGAKLGSKEFQRQSCPVRNCFITESSVDMDKANAILFRQYMDGDIARRLLNPDQIWIFYALEAPYSLPGYSGMKNAFNWTATYRRDSTIVAPYAKWVPFDPPVTSPSLDRNFAAGKTKQVAWFVSNCGANNNRLEYAKELSKYIDVDIYGLCGNDDCPKGNQDCWEKLNEDYKFYLSFENSNCRDYITEKFFLNGLGYDVIPIVMGAHPDDYRKVAPPHSYISVEDFTDPKSLAEFLNKLDNSNRKYNKYFHWKGTGKFINTKFWCRLCALLNDKDKPRLVVTDLEEWWSGEKVCRRDPWNPKRKF